jgi:hypothetical protein
VSPGTTLFALGDGRFVTVASQRSTPFGIPAVIVNLNAFEKLNNLQNDENWCA